MTRPASCQVEGWLDADAGLLTCKVKSMLAKGSPARDPPMAK